MEDYKMLLCSFAFIDNFIPLEQKINLFFPINRHIFTLLAQLWKMGTTALFFFVCLLNYCRTESTILETSFKVGQDRTMQASNL